MCLGCFRGIACVMGWCVCALGRSHIATDILRAGKGQSDADTAVVRAVPPLFMRIHGLVAFSSCASPTLPYVRPHERSPTHPPTHTLRTGKGQSDADAAAVRTAHPIPASCGVYYFEVLVEDKGTEGYVVAELRKPTATLYTAVHQGDLHSRPFGSSTVLRSWVIINTVCHPCCSCWLGVFSIQIHTHPPMAIATPSSPDRYIGIGISVGGNITNKLPGMCVGVRMYVRVCLHPVGVPALAFVRCSDRQCRLRCA